MSQSDYNEFTVSLHGLESGDVAKGVSSAFTPPNGGGNFVHVFRSVNAQIGFAGWYYSALSAFNPITGNKGGSVRCAMRRYAAGSEYAPMIGLIAGTDLNSAKAYLLGLTDSDPYQIALRKGLVGGGLDPTDSDILRISDASYSANTRWFHLRLDVIVNPHGDVILNVFENDLDINAVTSPDWQPISGMDAYTDDSVGVFTGTLPLTSSFRGFFGHYNGGETGKISLFDHFELLRHST